MKKNNKTGSTISSLSEKEISSIFAKIDKQIILLLKYSSKDFSSLNADCKKYYKLSKEISVNAKEIINLLTKGSIYQLFGQLQLLYTNLDSIQNQFTFQLESSIKQLRITLTNLDLLLPPLINLDQDLMTFKFLLANANLYSSESSNNSKVRREEMLTEYTQVVNEFQKCGFDCDKSISVLKEEITSSLVYLESLQNKIVIDISTILDNIHNGIFLFKEKHKEATRQIPVLTNITENCSKSLADIITNLQYQDIIQQKIEHIQTSQKHILVELEGSGESNNSNKTENSSRLFLKIRDVAGLQAAILVRTNKEFQLAIEKISQDFLRIGEDMRAVAEMCKQLNKSREDSDDLFLIKIFQKVNIASKGLNNFVETKTEYKKQIDKLRYSFNCVNEDISNILVFAKKHDVISSKLIDYVVNNRITEPSNNEGLSHLKTVILNIQTLKDSIQNVFKKVHIFANEISKEVIHQRTIHKKEETVVQVAESIQDILSQLNKKNSNLVLLLNATTSLSVELSHEIKGSIERIQDYDLFDKTIEKIINELNEIYQKLKVEISVYQTKEENLHDIKDLYTMESEFQIHQQILKSDGNINLFDDYKPETSDSGNDDIELF